jgi:hypothetical protein
MRIRTVVRAAATVSVIAIISVVLAPVALGQFQNPLKAAKDAWKKSQAQAKQQQQQQQNQQPQNANQSQPRVFSPQPLNQAPDLPPDSDCCTSAAMQNFAKQASFLDIVGIKLGMTPQQAFAAVRAFNPKMRIDIVKNELDIPGDPNGQDPRIPHYAVAQTAASSSTGSDIIVIEFTTPPNPPLVARISRGLVFPTGQSVLTSTLLDGLRKKYGQDQDTTGGTTIVWLYGPDGKLLERQLNDREKICSSVQPGATTTGNLSTFSIVLDTNSKANGYAVNGSPEITPACIPFTAASATNAYFNSPNAQNIQVTVGIESPALLYASYRSTQEWLQAKAASVQQQQQQAAKQRAAPKF